MAVLLCCSMQLWTGPILLLECSCATHTHTHTSNFLENSICPIFDSLAWRLQTPFDDSAMRQVKTLLTLRMFAQTGSLLGQVLLNGKVSYGSITVLGDWEVTDGFVASTFNEVLWISWVCWGCLNWRVDGRWGMDCGWLTRARVGGGGGFLCISVMKTEACVCVGNKYCSTCISCQH